VIQHERSVFAVFEVGEELYFVEYDPGLPHFLIFAARDGWLLRLHEDVVPCYLAEVA
jgi:hypothetical protein